MIARTPPHDPLTVVQTKVDECDHDWRLCMTCDNGDWICYDCGKHRGLDVQPLFGRAAAFANRHAQTVRYVACGLLGFIVQASLSAGDFTRMAVGVGVFVAFWFVWKQTGDA